MIKSISVVLLSASLFAVSAHADQSFSSETDFSNPNGCRVFDAVVSPDCDYDYATNRCEAALKALNDLNNQLPELNLSADCDRIHTGNFFKRMLDEIMMGSSSFDGKKLDVTSSIADGKDLPDTTATVQTPNAAVCADAAAAVEGLAQQGLTVTANCDASELRVQRK